ncbi:hypothetical protein A7E78_13350 [Syntrophotalea acetylenivorans]|uniref:Uncharacterized protein n=1 Tax=Syntrophotalea acetylenivorans TaxID=1842532 RepID=A0A1L3GS28_9BACT|nr:hypothetical protein A7E78_13350 [Syntrophotalea acetylenivorans]
MTKTFAQGWLFQVLSQLVTPVIFDAFIITYRFKPGTGKKINGLIRVKIKLFFRSLIGDYVIFLAVIADYLHIKPRIV